MRKEILAKATYEDQELRRVGRLAVEQLAAKIETEESAAGTYRHLEQLTEVRVQRWKREEREEVLQTQSQAEFSENQARIAWASRGGARRRVTKFRKHKRAFEAQARQAV